MEASLNWNQIGWASWVSVAGTLFALGAFVSSLLIRKTVRGAILQLSKEQAVALEGRLNEISNSLDDAVNAKRSDWVRSELEKWKREAPLVRGILSQHESVPSELLATLKKSATFAARSIEDMLEMDAEMTTAPVQVQRLISKACSEFADWVGQTSFDTGKNIRRRRRKASARN